MTATTPAYAKSIVYDRDTESYDMLLDGVSVGFARTQGDAENALNTLVHELLLKLPSTLASTPICSVCAHVLPVNMQCSHCAPAELPKPSLARVLELFLDGERIVAVNEYNRLSDSERFLLACDLSVAIGGLWGSKECRARLDEIAASVVGEAETLNAA